MGANMVGVTPLQAIQAVWDLYGYSASAPTTKWAYVTSPSDCPIYYGVAEIDDTVLVTFRGSTVISDFIRDMEVLADPLDHGLLGPVHPGAWAGMERVLEDTIFKRYPPQSVQFTGQSLGAMRATLATAWAVATYGPVIKPRIVFGEPKSGFAKSAALADVPGSISYWNKPSALVFDLVYWLPATVFPELYTHKTEPTLVNYAPDGTGPDMFWGIFAPHYSGYYLKAIKQLSDNDGRFIRPERLGL